MAITYSIEQPTLFRKPVTENDPHVYTGEYKKRAFYLPSRDGLLKYDVLVLDTPMGVYKHESEQRAAYGQAPPRHPFDLPSEEWWRAEFEIEGVKDTIEFRREEGELMHRALSFATRVVHDKLSEMLPDKP